MLEVSGSIKRGNSKLLILGAGVLIVALAALAGFFFWQYYTLKQNPNSVAQETTKRLVTEVGKIYKLPGGEEPTVAQVKDKEKLKDQSFFKDATNDDYILIYTNAKLALLYREKENKLINVGPISISSNEEQAKQQQPQVAPATNKKP